MKKYWIEKKLCCSLFFSILLVIVATIVTLILTNNGISIQDSVDNFNCNLNAYSRTKVFYSGFPSLKVANYKNQYRQLILRHTKNVDEVPSVSRAILKEAIKDIEFYKRRLVVAAEFNMTDNQSLVVNAMYSNLATHGAPVSLSLIVNTILKLVRGENCSISAAINFSQSLFRHKTASITRIRIYWTTLLPFAFLMYCKRFLFLPLIEKRTKLKHLHLMCGVRSLLYWTVCYVWDLFIYLLAVAFVMLIIAFPINLNDIFNKSKEIQMLFLILFAYGLSMISYIYVYSHCSVKKASCTHFIATCLAVSFLMGSTLYLMQKMKKFVTVLSCLFVTFPQFGLFYCIFKFSSQAVWNYNLKNRANCENNDVCCEDDVESCKQYQSYFFGQYGICYQLMTMYISTVLYFLIMTILEAKFTSKWSEKRLVHLNKNLRRSDIHKNTNVLQESQRIFNVYTEEQKRTKDVLEMYKTNANVDFYLVNRVKKMYNLIRVVKGVSFGLNRGDCFGILGKGGSGKTTIFHVLTGMSPVNTGGVRIYANDRFYYLYKNYKKYLQFIGYCPQNNVLIDVLTGRELLYFFAKIRGVIVQTKSEVTKWINLIGLEDCADKLCRDYNYGDKRKLSVCIALVGSPLIVMLDEPTTGVDPVSRKKIWKVIKTIQNQNIKPCIIFSSNNVEECEALCNKMVILVNGQFKTFGTMSNIKEEYAMGFIIKIKLSIFLMPVLKTSADDISLSSGFALNTDENVINLLVNDCREMFVGCVTREDKYSGLIYYHVKDSTKKWSDLFKQMEELKNKHMIIEDYDITEATLEDAFVIISKSNNTHEI